MENDLTRATGRAWAYPLTPSCKFALPLCGLPLTARSTAMQKIAINETNSLVNRRKIAHML